MLPAKKLFPQPARRCPILRVLFAKGGKRSHRTIRTLQGEGPLFLPYQLEQAAKKLRFALVWEGHECQLRKNSDSLWFGKGTSSTRAVNSDRSMAASSRWGNAACENTPFRAGFWEGHEFHSCRKLRPLNSGFQPLGECCPAKKLFPQPARGRPILRVLFAKGGKRSHRTIRTLQGEGPLFLPYQLEQAAEKLRFALVWEGHECQLRNNSVSRRVLGRARVPLVP